MNEIAMLQVSIVFATFKRADILRKTLNSFTQLNCSDIRYEIILADNAAEQATQSLVQEYANRLPITYVAEPKPGKNSALITALKFTQGELIIFTDDDIIADPGWVRELYEGSLRHPEAQLFGGRILPHYPECFVKNLSPIDFNHWFIRSALVIADWEQDEGAMDVGRIWGPNMAVKREVFATGLSFNPTIGPNGKDYVMGSETEFLERAQGAGFNSVYLPKALVHHQIRVEQLNTKWLQGRAYRAGKGRAATMVKKNIRWLWGAPRYLWVMYIRSWCKYQLRFLMKKNAKFNVGIELFLLKGQLEHCRKTSHQSQQKLTDEQNNR